MENNKKTVRQTVNSDGLCLIIADIGINHNGDLDIAKKLIYEAANAGFNAVKFQKRTIEEVYTPEELDRYRESPFGTTNREQKNGLEFGLKEYQEIDSFCRKNNIDWFASTWDLKSQEFLSKFDLKYNKIASAMLTVTPLLHKVASEKKYTFISTGMSTDKEIDNAVEIFMEYNCPFELMHCTSAYPTEDYEVNLNGMKTLREKFNCNVGYSGHEKAVAISIAAAVLGATSIERHITLDRTMYGSDQAASLEPQGFQALVNGIRKVKIALGDGKIGVVLESEKPARKNLATPYWYKKIIGKGS